MRISYEKARSVVNGSNPTMASEVQTCIDLLERYASNASGKEPMIDHLHSVVITQAESILADHYAAYTEQTATV